MKTRTRQRRELGIVLTSRGKAEKKAPLAGVPYHALETYLGRLIKKGYKVAIIEQLEDPKLAKGLVKRGLVRIVTPGTVIESSLLNEKREQLHPVFNFAGRTFCCCPLRLIYRRIFTITLNSMTHLHNLLARFTPSECVIPESLKVDTELVNKIKTQGCFLNGLDDYFFKAEKARETILNHFNAPSLHQFGLEEEKGLANVAGALLRYLHDTQKNSLAHIKKITVRSNETTMLLDSSTIKNLELAKISVTVLPGELYCRCWIRLSLPAAQG